ncbi:DUF305 domain-containing protein [Winogradskya consettensis]|uniref:Lipoprotein n=1 Tax=Winogradskya consettensis TaxID=113560 RepID=A0A919S999_9ACTN|nr:DUF305 domain-containing protein [Actinoplanes consettensis]GIM67111.1 lipoprotein [Actinoplanes consettensis]
MTRSAKFAAAGVALAVAIFVVVVTRSDDRESAAAPRPSVSSTPPQRVVLPGRPGESARVSDSDKIKAPGVATFNSIDTAFTQMMIVHHGQAVTMAALAPGRAGDKQLAQLAARIGAAQTPEIAWMQGWLRDRRLPATDPSHNHATMPGMQSDTDMATLATLVGADFDRKFVAMMTSHHQGAIQMANDVLRGGSDLQLNEMAGEMAIEQGGEIARMADLSS